jgi:hypothetical protein
MYETFGMGEPIIIALGSHFRGIHVFFKQRATKFNKSDVIIFDEKSLKLYSISKTCYRKFCFSSVARDKVYLAKNIQSLFTF